MTIGSSYNYPSHIAKDARKKRSPNTPWAGRFPNPPDLCFDYRALVEQEHGIAKATDPHHRICIIGAGVTGLTAARELHRCGFTRITLIEQSTHIGGRHLTVPGSRSSEAFWFMKVVSWASVGAGETPAMAWVTENQRASRVSMAWLANTAP